MRPVKPSDFSVEIVADLVFPLDDAGGPKGTSAARTAWQILEEAFPIDDALPTLAVLIEAVERRAGIMFVDHDAVAESRRVLNDHFAPAALRVFGDPAGANWIVPLWRDAAQSAARLAFRADRGEDHAAPL